MIRNRQFLDCPREFLKQIMFFKAFLTFLSIFKDLFFEIRPQYFFSWNFFSLAGGVYDQPHFKVEVHRQSNLTMENAANWNKAGMPIVTVSLPHSQDSHIPRRPQRRLAKPYKAQGHRRNILWSILCRRHNMHLRRHASNERISRPIEIEGAKHGF